MEAYLAWQALQSIVSYLIMVLTLSFLVWGVEGQASGRFDADGSVTLVTALVVWDCLQLLYPQGPHLVF